MKEMVITFLLGLALIGLALYVYADRTSRINNGEMVLVDQHEK